MPGNDNPVIISLATTSLTYSYYRTVKSPQILELSGIGNPSVLANLGIKVQVELPGVGENLQEHLFNTLGPYELEAGTSHETLDLLKDPRYAANARALQLSHSVTKLTCLLVLTLPSPPKAPTEWVFSAILFHRLYIFHCRR